MRWQEGSGEGTEEEGSGVVEAKEGGSGEGREEGSGAGRWQQQAYCTPAAAAAAPAAGRQSGTARACAGGRASGWSVRLVQLKRQQRSGSSSRHTVVAFGSWMGRE
jgi:hypothetical protein